MYNDRSYYHFDKYSHITFKDCLIISRNFHKIAVLHLNSYFIKTVSFLVNWGSKRENEIK